MRRVVQPVGIGIARRRQPHATGRVIHQRHVARFVATKGFGKLFTPLIRRTLPKQTMDAMTKLKALAEQG